MRAHAVLFALALSASPLLAVIPITINLELVNIAVDPYTGTNSGTDGPQYKLGIYVGLDGGAPKLYEFDTGAAGFFPAFYENGGTNYTDWWSGGTPTSQTITMDYSSGNVYQSTVVRSSVSLYSASNLSSPAVSLGEAHVGRIDANTADPDWNSAIVAGQAPLQNYFWGDFGSGLYRNRGFASPPGNDGLFAILPQLGDDLSHGFIVMTGGYGNSNPKLQIGITDADRAAYPIAIPMNGNGDSAITFPHTGEPVYETAIINALMTLFGAENQELGIVGVITDTGATSANIHEGNALVVDSDLTGGGLLAPGVTLSLANGEGWTFEITEAEDPLEGVSKINVTAPPITNIYAPQGGYVNSGITFFYDFNVMYDVEQGFLRLQPVPEPSTLAFLAGGLAFAVVFRRRRS